MFTIKDNFKSAGSPSIFRACAFSFLLFAFCSAAFAQLPTSAIVYTHRSELDWLAEVISKGSTEAKRDALLRIKNLEIGEASQIALPALRDDSEIVRATAAGAVVFLDSDIAAQNLLPLLADKKPLVRREAAYALGKVRHPPTINRLLQTIQKDKVSEVRNAAIVALGEIGDASAVPELVKILLKKPQNKEEFARRAAARAIGQIAQIIQTGETTVLTPENFLPENVKLIEPPKYAILIDVFPVFQQTFEPLTRILRDPKEAPDVKREAAFALGAIGDSTAISVLQTKTSDEDYYLAEISREALRKIAAAERR